MGNMVGTGKEFPLARQTVLAEKRFDIALDELEVACSFQIIFIIAQGIMQLNLYKGEPQKTVGNEENKENAFE